MEEVQRSKYQVLKENISKYLPIIISIFVIMVIGLSMIGPFYEIKLKVDGVKTYQYFSLIDLIAQNPASVRVAVFFILLYLVFPVIACILLYFTKINKNFSVVSLLIFLLCGVTSIVSKDAFIYVYISSSGLDYSISSIYFTSILPTIGYFVSSILVLSIAFKEVDFDVRDITEMGILIAIALGLNFIKVMPLPTGGSINLQMLPLFLLALRRGPLKGFIGGGIAYGIISCLTDGYGFAFFPFDYLIGFGSTCVLGFLAPHIFSSKQNGYNLKGEILLLVGGIAASFIRFIGGTISSMIFYDYHLIAAMEYNAAYVFISGGISIALIMALYGPLAVINNRFPTKKEELPE